MIFEGYFFNENFQKIRFLGNEAFFTVFGTFSAFLFVCRYVERFKDVLVTCLAYLLMFMKVYGGFVAATASKTKENEFLRNPTPHGTPNPAFKLILEC